MNLVSLRRSFAIVLALGVVAALAACGGGGDGETTTVTASVSAEDADTSPPEPDPVASGAVLNDADDLEPITIPSTSDLGFFATPGGEVACSIDRAQVRCDVPSNDWGRERPKPAACDLDWGTAVGIGSTGVAEPLCVGDTVVGAEGERLAPGQSLTAYGFRCENNQATVTCGRVQEGSEPTGFSVSPAELTLFGIG